MSKKQRKKAQHAEAPVTDNLRLDPEQRLCAKFDGTSVAEFTVAKRDKMGVRVEDNCAEEHIM